MQTDATRAPPHPAPKVTYSVTDTMFALGLSRQAVYDEITRGRLRSFKLGRRRLIPATALTEWVETMQASDVA